VRRIPLPLLTILALTAGLLTGLGPGTPSAQANVPDRVLSGWMPYWMTSPGRPEGVDSAVANADLFEDVSPFWYSATAKAGGGVQVRLNPNFSNAASNIAWAMPRLRGAGLTVIPSIADASGKGRMAATLADPNLRAQHVADLVALSVENGYDGLDINYENFAFTDGRSSWDATLPNWTAFVAELGAALKSQGKLLSVTIPGPCDTRNRCGDRNGYWVYNLPGIAPHADRVRIMAYDYTVQSIGPIAPIGWVRANVEHAVTVMDPAKLQIGVPTYGRARTRTVSGGGYRLSGVCPSNNGSSAQRRAWRSATAMSSVTARDIPELLATYGLSDADVTWDPETQESYFRYTKQVEWTDNAGNRQVCNAERQVNFVGPDAVLARTQLVGQYGLNGAALWTIGGENPVQWNVLRSYAQTLAPAEASIAIDGTPAVAFGQPTSVAGGVTMNGAPVPDIPVTLEFLPAGATDWQALQVATSGPDGAVAYQVILPGSGRIRLTTPAVGAMAASLSGEFQVSVAATVTARVRTPKVGPSDRIRVRAIVRPALADQKVVLQVFKNERWRKVKVARTNAKGRVTIIAQAEGSRQRWNYRIVARRSGGISPGVSQEFRIRVR
jgi:spore germination protein YaaH